jgi:hypothetical protein
MRNVGVRDWRMRIWIGAVIELSGPPGYEETVYGNLQKSFYADVWQ